MSVATIVVVLWAVFLPLIAVSVGAIKPRRDVFMLLVYVQSVIYIDLAPAFAATDVNDAMKSRYAWLQVWALLLFQIPLLLAYIGISKRRQKRLPAEREFRFSPSRLMLLSIGSTLLGIGYFVVAARYGLLYRRVGEGLASVQLSMGMVDFVLYRSFIELGPFLAAAQLFVLRTSADLTPLRRKLGWTGVAVTAGLYLGYAIINTRLYTIITIASLMGIVMLTERTDRRMRPMMLAWLFIGALGGLYSLKVIANVRATFSTGGSLLAIENFLPFASVEGGARDDSFRWRLNGVDLMAIIADNVETQGAAHGAAWAVPFVVSLDPIVRTPFSVQVKEAGLTTAKIWLLLKYGGVAKTDYYSCMLTDAYGNFSIYGFALVALVVGTVLAYGTSAVQLSASPAAVLFGLFALTRILPFEQEFDTILFGWFKLVPFVLICLVFYPLRRVPVRDTPHIPAAA